MVIHSHRAGGGSFWGTIYDTHERGKKVGGW